jgi:TatD DNase family protein
MQLLSLEGSTATNAYNYQLCDIGANLCDEMYAGFYNDKKRHPNDLLAVLQRARATNVSKILCTAGSVDDSRRTLQLLRTPVPVQWRSQAVSPSLDDLLPALAVSASPLPEGEASSSSSSGREAGAVAMAEQYGLYMTVGVHPTRAALFLPDDAEPQPSSGSGSEGSSSTVRTGSTGSRVLDELLSIIVDANGDAVHRIEESSGASPSGSSSATSTKVAPPRRTVIALGECGLDYARLEFCSKEQQLAGFRLQLQLASHPLVDLPLFLHSRDTDGDFLRVMRESRHLYARRGGVVHSFDGTVEEMLAL